MSSATIGIRELRDGLSRHIASVREGEEIIVTDHGTPVARIVPFRRESSLERMIRDGLVTLPTGPRAETYPAPIKTSGTVSDLVAESRGRY